MICRTCHTPRDPFDRCWRCFLSGTPMTLVGHFIDDTQRRDNAVRLVLYAVNAPVGGTWATLYTRRSPRVATRNGRARDAGQEWASA